MMHDQFVKVFNNTKEFPSMQDVARELGLSVQTVKNKAVALRRTKQYAGKVINRNGVELPLSENTERIREATAEECIEHLRTFALLNSEKGVTRDSFRKYGPLAESAWNHHFGTFNEFMRQAQLKLSRQQHQLERHVAKHVSVDHYRNLAEQRASYAAKYERKDKKRFQTILVCSDLHDELVDPFYLRVLIDTAKRVQPEIIALNGDVWDATEFGRYAVDPRNFDVVGKIKFVHERILKPLREACPNAQIDWISGNHEDRLVKHLADATPAMKVLLSDLHGFTVGSLLALDKFQVNFIAKSDLGAYTATNIKSEVAKNYKVYFDCYATNHFPEGVKLGLPGTNGHSHKFKVTPCYNEIFGSYSWIQTGCGHLQDASYCNAEKWDMGFLLAHIDTEKKAVNQEYIPITDFAVVGGQFYYRNAKELVRVVA
jgi:hypothetical protein